MKISEKIELNKISIEAFEKLQAEVAFYNSLKSSIRMAGGCADWLDENTTLKELANYLVINGIRFTYYWEEE